jgi:RES domain-containing protein
MPPAAPPVLQPLLPAQSGPPVKIWRICRECYAAEAFSGDGARRFGGRWNSRGVPMVYASTSLALAAIELFVHLEPNQASEDLVAIAAELPGAEPAIRWKLADLPTNWSTDEFAPARDLGDTWIRSKQSLAVYAPSVPIPQEWNVLLNPLHPRIGDLSIQTPSAFHFDSRMFAGH